MYYRLLHAEPDLNGVRSRCARPLRAALAKKPEDRPTLLELLRHLEPHPAAPGQRQALVGDDTAPGPATAAGRPVRASSHSSRAAVRTKLIRQVRRGATTQPLSAPAVAHERHRARSALTTLMVGSLTVGAVLGIITLSGARLPAPTVTTVDSGAPWTSSLTTLAEPISSAPQPAPPADSTPTNATGTYTAPPEGGLVTGNTSGPGSRADGSYDSCGEAWARVGAPVYRGNLATAATLTGTPTASAASSAPPAAPEAARDARNSGCTRLGYSPDSNRFGT